MGTRSVVADGLSALDDRLHALQTAMAQESARAMEAQTTLARAVAEQTTAHAVLAQWMKDWTTEVAAWRKCLEDRAEGLDAQQKATGRELEQARGAMKVALWVFGTALTLVTGVFSGVMVRVLGELVAHAGR